ncbi:MAG: hypothetical protein JXR37_32865, partial [Kiritimatiellae bacterium]|nr:hypothetical protein [Kiritimatiellia bacterium]
PTNSESCFRLTDVQRTNSFTVTFACTNSRVYGLELNTNLVLGPWSFVPGETNKWGEGDGEMSLTDPADATQRNYRVGVSVP